VSPHFQRQLQLLASPDQLPLLTQINRGIEKESLRITADGTLAQTPHPAGLGSPLTHGTITTDYSEALMEFITPVCQDIADSLNTLEDVHSFVYSHLDNELLWSASMPCIMGGDSLIPVAQFGHANIAQMKTIYRLGLGHRYGRLMQTIAGIHYNFSMPESWWQLSHQTSKSSQNLTDFISAGYLGLIRNFQRYSWLLIYLYGASPATCASFLKGSDKHGLQPFDQQGNSLYLPYATALRMGDLGYQSNAQKDLNICYNSLESYIDTLKQAILQPHPPYQAIGIKQNGNYKQLNEGLLQIENEFYSPIRPKRVTRSGETPLGVLKSQGIEYIEVRCIDVSPFTPLGIDQAQVQFLDTFLLFCLLSDSPDCDEHDRNTIASNLERVVNRGREPGLLLQTNAGERPLKEMAAAVLSGMDDIASLLDQAHSTSSYSATMVQQRAKIDDPELTPSARILREMGDKSLPFYKLALRYSQQWQQHFRDRTPGMLHELNRQSNDSLAKQADIEAADTLSFEHYLADYYQQYQDL